MHLSVVPHNRFGDLVEAALRVEQSTTAMYQSRQESKRSVPGASQQSFGQYSRKRNKMQMQLQMWSLVLFLSLIMMLIH